MSTKKKKQHRSPRRPEVSFIKIYEKEENPWPQDYYMCGMCGHAVAAKDVERHAIKNHNASSYRVLEIDDSVLTEEEIKEQQALGLIPESRGGSLLDAELGDDHGESSPADAGVPGSTGTSA